MQKVLALAAETSAVDDDALVLLGQSLLSALIGDPETPEPLKNAAARLLRNSGPAPSVADGCAPEEEPD